MRQLFSSAYVGNEDRGRTEAFWQPGELIADNWEIRDIKYGGMGTVYVVFDRSMDQLMVAKTCRPPYDSDHASQFLDLFKRECSIWLNLDIHPNIVEVLMIHEIHGWPYLFLEYVEGDSLRRRIGGPAPAESLPQTCLWGIHICDGMTHALSKGLKAHDDLRPENCLIDAETNLLKITDFGLSRTQNPRDANQAAHVSGGGSPRYMAPERFDSIEAGGVCSDVYSIGTILFEIANGRPPFLARTWTEYARVHREAEIPALSEQFSPLQEIVMRCLQTEPADRFQTFSDLRSDLSLVYQELTGDSVQPSPTDVTDYALKGTWKGDLVQMDLPPELAGGQLYSLPASHFANKAVSLGRLDMPDLALECCNTALRLDPGLQELLINKGTFLLRLERADEAADCFDEFLQTLDASGPYATSQWQAAMLNKATALSSLGRKQEALNHLDQVISKQPAFVAFATKAGILNELGRWREALYCYDEATKLEPSSFHCWAQMGFLLSEYGHSYEDGNRCYECALALDPNAIEWRVNKGINLIRLEKFQEAVDCLEEVLSVNDQYETAWYEKGLALCGLDDNVCAASCFEKALTLRPEFGLALRGKGLLLLESGNPEAALPCLLRARDLGVAGLDSAIEFCKPRG